jgi:tetratricopeptide (TPR) repeat protein
LQVLDGKTLDAIPVLKRMAAGVSEGDDPFETQAERERRWRLLASAYVRAGLHDLAGEAFDELVRIEPRSQEYPLRAAEEWLQSGDAERALQRYESLSITRSRSAQASLGLAEARLDLQLRKSGTEGRDWRGVNAALVAARKMVGDNPRMALVEASAAIARNDFQAALDILKNLLSRDKELDVSLLPRVASLLQEAGASDEADAVVERHAQSGGDAVAAVLVRSEILHRRGDAARAVEALEEALQQPLAGASRSLLARRLIFLEIDAGAMRSARGRLYEMRKEKTSELWVYETAADLAILAGDFAELKEWEDELHELEGPGGWLWRYVQAVRTLETEKDTSAATRQANLLVEAIQAARPNWAETIVLRGRIEQRLGHIAQAI